MLISALGINMSLIILGCLYDAVLCSDVLKRLCYALLCCTLMCSTLLGGILLYCTLLCCTLLCSVLLRSILLHSTLLRSTLLRCQRKERQVRENELLYQEACNYNYTTTTSITNYPGDLWLRWW